MNTRVPNSAADHSALDGWIDVFRAGRHTDSNGVTRDWTEAQLDQIVASADGADAAPVVIGHPQTDSPAYAWMQSVRRVGDRLQTRMSDIEPKFREAVEAGRYRNRSISFLDAGDGKWKIRHLAFLGGQPPAVEGLAPTQFSDDDGEQLSYEFQAMTEERPAEDHRFRTIRMIFEKQRDWITEMAGMRTAGMVMPKWRLDALDPNRPEYSDDGNGVSHNTDDNQSTDHQEGDVNTDTGNNSTVAAATLAQDRAKLESERAEFQARLEQQARTRRLEEARTLIGGHVDAARVLPAERERLTAFAASLDHGDDESTIEFAADDGQRVKKSQRDIFAEFLKALPERVPLGEDAGTENGAAHELSNEEISGLAVDYRRSQAEKGIIMTTAQAVDHVRREKGVTT